MAVVVVDQDNMNVAVVAVDVVVDYLGVEDVVDAVEDDEGLGLLRDQQLQHLY